MPPSDQVWRERGLRDAVLAGDERAWRALYDASFDSLYAYAQWRLGGLRHAAEELTQETWLVAVRRIGAFDPEQGPFLAWLRGIAANLIRNYLRRPRRLRLSVGDQEAADDTGRRETAEEIARALAALPEDQEAVLREKYLEQRSVEEIAAQWGRSAKAIESLLSRARVAFRGVYPTPDAAPAKERK
ncbi:MAG: sigma-70 family RNA polymerase sigma factor [Gemmataceae bacterium]